VKAVRYKTYRPTRSLWREQFHPFEIHRSLDFKGCDTQYSTHALHTYVAAMVPQLAEHLVTTYVPKGQTVFDPFCGGGAVMAEAVRHSRRAIGSDINPLAALIAKVKSTYVKRQAIEKACMYVGKHAERGIDGSMKFPDNYNIEYWFHPYTISELSSIALVLKRCEQESLFSKDVIDVLKLVFSATVRDVMLTYRNEVRLRRLEPSDLRKFKPNAFICFAQRSKLAASRIGSLPKEAFAQIYVHDVRSLPHPDKSFHSIICSPPYGDERNGVSYLQFSKYMLYWLGFTRDTVIDARNRTIGSLSSQKEVPSETYMTVSKEIISNGADNGGLAFYAGYYSALKEMVRVIREYVIIVIGNRVLKQVVIENGRITAELMDSLGWNLAERYERTLPSKRLPKLRRELSHGFGGAIDKEDVLVFRED
jgi:site-specific DNA-methyltransferase (cytosine-N4-specific)